MARPLRIEYPGAFYHVTARGNEQKEIFRSHKDREKFLSYLESATRRYGAAFHCYCLMSNHYHLLLETPKGNLSRIMQHINGAYTTYFNLKRKRSGHLLQGRFKAILIEADSYAAELSRYIHLNPVRANVVENPEAYPWTSYQYYTVGVAPPWLRTDFILGYFGKKAAVAREHYQRFVNEMLNQEYDSPLREAVASTILGSAAFVDNIREEYLNAKKADRDLPALRDLRTDRASVAEIVKVVEEVVDDDVRQARRIGIYLSHRHSGAKLREIGEKFNLSESGVTRASKRLSEAMEGDKALRKKIGEIKKRLSLSSA